MTQSVRERYLRYPYPPIPWAQLPILKKLRALELPGVPKTAIVFGAGTFEPVALAAQNPTLELVVAVDLSSKSLEILRKRWNLFRWTRKLRLTQTPRLITLVADLHDEQGLRRQLQIQGAPSQYDVGLASNVLQHTADPAQALRRCSEWIRLGGTLRLVTYPEMSRVWMRELSAFFGSMGLNAEMPDLRARCVSALLSLPISHPLRTTFRSQPEIFTHAGLVDAFFHPLENPIRPLQWLDAAHRASLRLVEQVKNPERWDEHPDFVQTLLPEYELSPLLKETPELKHFYRLELLDASLELQSNPVFYFEKIEKIKDGATLGFASAPTAPRIESHRDFKLLMQYLEQLLLWGAPSRDRAVSAREWLKRLEHQSQPSATPGLRLFEQTI